MKQNGIIYEIDKMKRNKHRLVFCVKGSVDLDLEDELASTLLLFYLIMVDLQFNSVQSLAFI